MISKRTIFYPLFAMVLLFFIASPALATTNGVVYVAGDGSGNFNCKNDGNAQIQINQALQFVAQHPGYTTVHLKGGFTYVISKPIYIGSNTILEGDSSAVVKLKDHARWAPWIPLISQMYSGSNYRPESNITIRGFTVNVNYGNNTDVLHGSGYYNVIQLSYCNGITVNNMCMYDGAGDGLRANNCKNIKFYNNEIYKLGHDGMYAVRSQNVEAWNNCITCRINSGLRIWNSDNVKFHDNLIDSFYQWSAGGPGIQIEKSEGSMKSVEVYDNTIHNTYGPGIWIVGYDNASQDMRTDKIYIHNNVLYSDGTNPSINWVGGILTSGVNNIIIEKNIFDVNYNSGIIAMCPYSDISPTGSGYKISVKNNIITNTKRRTYSPSGTGYGIENDLSKTHSMSLTYNCLYKNYAGNYKDVTPVNDIHVDPLYTNSASNNYQLRSTSPFARILGTGKLGYTGASPSTGNLNVKSMAVLKTLSTSVPSMSDMTKQTPFTAYIADGRGLGKSKGVTADTIMPNGTSRYIDTANLQLKNDPAVKNSALILGSNSINNSSKILRGNLR